jgi:hypothetical protein
MLISIFRLGNSPFAIYHYHHLCIGNAVKGKNVACQIQIRIFNFLFRCESRNMQDHDLICPDYFAQWAFSVNKIGKPNLEGLQKCRNKMAKFFETKNIGVLYN